MPKKTISKQKRDQGTTNVNEKVCFVISPIGKEGTAAYSEFKEVLDFIIKPAFEEAEPKYSVIRADAINRSGSFIKDILESIYSAHVVVADLTGQNPNVFYELGVRHCIRPRTILIARNVDDIPSDLREYRTIIYDTSAKGAAAFKKKIKEFLAEIQNNSERPDNPVLDRLGNIVENKLSQVEAERDSLKIELSKLLSGKVTAKPSMTASVSVRTRFNRILELKNAERQGVLGGHFSTGEKKYELPRDQGNFELFFLLNGTSINGYWYVSIRDKTVNLDEELSDIRVLIDKCSKGQNVNCDFIIVTGSDITEKKQYQLKFKKITEFIPKDSRSLFKLYLLDPSELSAWEQDFGLKI
ncbi:MAG TPA: hypothetical protein VLX29_03070 [Nitrospirota bacterium]|nr:hypothetical protein [Nitrospirota bacterium]